MNQNGATASSSYFEGIVPRVHEGVFRNVQGFLGCLQEIPCLASCEAGDFLLILVLLVTLQVDLLQEDPPDELVELNLTATVLIDLLEPPAPRIGPVERGDASLRYIQYTETCLNAPQRVQTCLQRSTK